MQDAGTVGRAAAEALPAEAAQGGSGPAAWDDDEDDELVNLQQQGWVRTANSYLDTLLLAQPCLSLPASVQSLHPRYPTFRVPDKQLGVLIGFQDSLF